MANKKGPTVRPLTEGYEVKGGQNPATSQIHTRPAAPAPIPSSPPPTPAANRSVGAPNSLPSSRNAPRR